MVRRPSRVLAAIATALLLKRQFALILALATLALVTLAHALAPLLNNNRRAKKDNEDCTGRCSPFFMYLCFGSKIKPQI